MSYIAESVTFTVEARPDRSRVVLVARGELDLATRPTLENALDDLRRAGWDHILLDVRELSFIDSTGLSLLLATDRNATEHGWTFELTQGGPAVARMLEIVGMSERFRPARDRPGVGVSVPASTSC